MTLNKKGNSFNGFPFLSETIENLISEIYVRGPSTIDDQL